MSHYLIEQLRGKPNIAVRLNSEIRSVHGDTHLTAVDVLDRIRGETRREDSGGLFVFIGADAETAWLPAEIARDGHGYIPTGDDVVKTAIFACGDVRLSPVKRVASAVGEGSMAIAFVHRYLQDAGCSESGRI